MIRDALSSLLVIAACTHAFSGPTSTQPPANQIAGNQTPGNETTAEPSDPAAVRFSSPTGLVLHAIKPGAVADYEAVIAALQGALAKATDQGVQRVAASWKVYKAAERDAKGNALYVHLLEPVDNEVDYRPSLWLDKLVEGAPAELLAKYRESFASQPSKLSLSDFAKVTVVPANATPEGPRPNASPSKPTALRSRY